MNVKKSVITLLYHQFQTKAMGCEKFKSPHLFLISNVPFIAVVFFRYLQI